MGGFYDLSDDTDNDSAIDEIISQAKDAVVLDQLSAINCSGFTDSVLPTHLETRFRNLKSFPPTKPKPNTNTKARTFSTLSSTNHQSPNLSPSKHNPNEKPEHASVSVSSPPFGSASASSPSSDESSMSSIFKPTQKEGSKQNSVSVTSNSPSPPRGRGCLCFSPKKKKEEKKIKKKKSKENWGEDLLPEMGSFSRKEQQKILKKAMKEEEKVSREAEKIVQWAKQASARFNLENELSD